MASFVRLGSQTQQPEVNIVLDEHNDTPHAYTTFDSLSGQVSITSPQNAEFDQVQITLEGRTRTYIDMMSPVASQTRSTATHLFLRLAMPIEDSQYPQPRIAEAGSTYKFPFNFVIPDQLLLSACNHDCEADHVRAAHLKLPPSMGDDSLSKSAMSPDMAKISYCIKVRVLRFREDNGPPIVLTEGEKKLLILPALPEEPPKHVHADDKEYNLSATKVLRKGMFKGKMGQITISAAQPKSLVLSPNGRKTPTTVATIKLRFDPADAASQPPRLGCLSSRLRASTFHAIKGQNVLPCHASTVSPYEIHRRVYSSSISLASRNVEAVNWTHHLASPQYARRDSGYSTASTRSGSCTPSNDGTITGITASDFGWYEASILVPISLPADKALLPSFHSCLISRVYFLSLDLSVHTPGTAVPSSTLSLRLPIQLSSESAGSQTNAELQDITAEVNEQLTTDSEQPPQFRLGSISADGGDEAPPGYDTLRRPSRAPMVVPLIG